jgi:XXXCH domain-containing protein
MELKGMHDDQVDGTNEANRSSRQIKNRPAIKRKSSDYEVLNATMNAGLKPPQVLFETFMKEADLMGTYERYGEEYYEAISILRDRFAEAFADNDVEQMVDLYEELESLKLQHHRRHN